MRKRCRVLLFSAAMVTALLHATAASAAVRDGDALLKQCTATIGALMAFCFGYIDAVTDAVLENGGFGDVNVCISAALDDVQLKNIVVRFLERSRRDRRLPAPTLVARALAEAFPCR
jgi:Ssp1 endopeptidase immunity protein Rap1a